MRTTSGPDSAALSNGTGRRRFATVTTCHAQGYEAYGRAMVESYLAHWPDDVPLLLYSEGFRCGVEDPRVVEHDLLEAAPDLAAFKARHRDHLLAHGRQLGHRPDIRLIPREGQIRVRLRSPWGLGFRWEAVRFSHKIFAILTAAVETDADVLFWLDADSRFFADVTHAELDALMPADCLLSYLRRKNISECGFVGYNLRPPMVRSFLADFGAFYRYDLLFHEKEFHDSYLFDRLRRRYERAGARTFDIAVGAGLAHSHVMEHSRLARFMEHLKGNRKHV